MPLPLTLKITDDSGFLAIVNADQFNSFIGHQWELPQLLQRCVEEMNNDHLLIWATGLENKWGVKLLENPTNEKVFREISKTIKVTNGRLYLTNYEDLTMAAQFSDERIPSKHNANLCIELDNGTYEITVRQLFDPKDHDPDEEDVGFEIIIQKPGEKSPRVTNVFWFEE